MYNIKTKDTDYFIIVTTHECGRKCPFCVDKYRGRNEYISLGDVERGLDYAETLNVKDIFLTGGEPTNHPNIVEIAKMAKNLMFHIMNKKNCQTQNNLNRI